MSSSQSMRPSTNYERNFRLGCAHDYSSVIASQRQEKTAEGRGA